MKKDKPSPINKKLNEWLEYLKTLSNDEVWDLAFPKLKYEDAAFIEAMTIVLDVRDNGFGEQICLN